MKRYLPSAIFLAIVLLLWQMGAGHMDAAYILPTPTGIVRKLWELREPLFMIHLPATMKVTGIGLVISVVLGLGLAVFNGCQPGGGAGFISDCYRLPNDSHDSNCPVVCRLVWLWNMEQDCGYDSHDIFPDYDYSV